LISSACTEIKGEKKAPVIRLKNKQTFKVGADKLFIKSPEIRDGEKCIAREMNDRSG
jgi:hypothetical protein